MVLVRKNIMYKVEDRVRDDISASVGKHSVERAVRGGTSQKVAFKIHTIGIYLLVKNRANKYYIDKAEA